MSKFEKGKVANPNGRPKGILDWRATYQETIEKLRKFHHDPVEAMIALATDRSEDRKLRFLADKELMARIAPPIKAITIQTEISDRDALEELKDQLSEALMASFKQSKQEY